MLAHKKFFFSSPPLKNFMRENVPLNVSPPPSSPPDTMPVCTVANKLHNYS
jgi:hypothetical protein